MAAISRYLKFCLLLALASPQSIYTYFVESHSQRFRPALWALSTASSLDHEDSHGTTRNLIQSSQIRSIRSHNLCGVTSIDNVKVINAELPSSPGEIVIPFEDSDTLVAVTGESGSGKSLLVARVVELLTGGKTSAGFLTSDTATASVQMEISLDETYLRAAINVFDEFDLDTSSLTKGETKCSGKGLLSLGRTLSRQSSNGKARLKSDCRINGQPVTLKVLTSIASPLLAVVDAAVAASALSKPEARLAILDTDIRQSLFSEISQRKSLYRKCRRDRERLEAEIAKRTLPKSFTALDEEVDPKLLDHWIDELDAFEARVVNFCRSFSRGTTDDGSSLSRICLDLASTSWTDDDSTDTVSFSSTIHTQLSNLRDELRSMDVQIQNVANTADTLSQLSSPNSVATALDRARNLLVDAARSTDESDRISEACERSHELLNDIEVALQSCSKFLEDDNEGPLQLLQNSRAKFPLPIESVTDILLDWNTLARKHGILPVTLPSCHQSLVSERDGSSEAQSLLPDAIQKEKDALEAFKKSCSVLSEERERVAGMLSGTVTRRLSSLGMESAFQVGVTRSSRSCSDATMYNSNTHTGLDESDFSIRHADFDGDGDNEARGGPVHTAASSGEKARILLAMECALPGSIGAACTTAPTAPSRDLWRGLPPLAIVYDEIDAHVGGRAATSLVNLLIDQSKSSQIVVITHSPSVAANAHAHVVVQTADKNTNEKAGASNETHTVRVAPVEGVERRKELARMASGDLVTKEAEIFADALLRDGLQNRQRSSV